MNYKRAGKLVIGLMFVIFPMLILINQGLCQSREVPAAKGDTVPLSDAASHQSVTNNHVVEVFYFHAKARCYSCTKIERLTEEAVREAFGSEIKKGLVMVRAINVEEPGNKHFIKDYQLYTKSVIVSDVIGGKEERWKNLTRVWELLNDERAFKTYVQSEIKEYLGAKKL
jgi:hypothetical protein